MIRIKEDKVKGILQKFKNKDLKIKIKGIIEQNITIKCVEIESYDNIEFKIYNNENKMVLNLSFIDEIWLEEESNIKFLINNDLEILIIK